MHIPKRPVSPGPKTRKQLADEYGISRKTLYNWLQAHDVKLPRRLLTVAEQQQIYAVLGPPPMIPPVGGQQSSHLPLTGQPLT